MNTKLGVMYLFIYNKKLITNLEKLTDSTHHKVQVTGFALTGGQSTPFLPRVWQLCLWSPLARTAIPYTRTASPARLIQNVSLPRFTACLVTDHSRAVVRSLTGSSQTQAGGLARIPHTPAGPLSGAQATLLLGHGPRGAQRSWKLSLHGNLTGLGGDVAPAPIPSAGARCTQPPLHCRAGGQYECTGTPLPVQLNSHHKFYKNRCSWEHGAGASPRACEGPGRGRP